MKESEFKAWRRNNLAIGVIGVVAAMAGTILCYMDKPHGYWLVVGGAAWYMIFYLRYVVVRRWYEADEFNALLEDYHVLRGTVTGQSSTMQTLKARIDRMARRHLRRDIMIAELLTRRFVFPILNRYARDYRHALVLPVIEMIENGILTEVEVIHHLDEPAAFADVLHDRLGKNPGLASRVPRLIKGCKGHWPDPSNVAA